MQGLGLGLGITPQSSALAFGPEARALFARMSVQPSLSRKVAINKMVSSLVAAGVWAKLDCLYLLAAHDAQAARLNWVQDAYNLATVSSPSFTTDRGYTGNGTSSYLDGSFNPTAGGIKYSQDAASIGAWPLTNVDELSADLGQNSSYLLSRYSNLFFGNVNQNPATNNTVATASSIGFRAAVRSSSTAVKSYVAGSVAGTFSVASTAPDNFSYPILARRQAAGTVNLFSTRQTAMAFIGGSLTDGQITSFYTAAQAYMTAVGAA